MADLGGRPTVMTDDVLRKLEEAFMRGLSDRQACLYAGIAESTLYEYQKGNAAFSERKNTLKENVKLRARLNVFGAIERGDLDASKWYLDRKDDEFKPKQATDMTMNANVSILDRVRAARKSGDTDHDGG